MITPTTPILELHLDREMKLILILSPLERSPVPFLSSSDGNEKSRSRRNSCHTSSPNAEKNWLCDFLKLRVPRVRLLTRLPVSS